MISINYLGRLGNNLIQYFAGRILAEKYNLYLNSKPKNEYDWGSFFSIPEPVNGIIKGSSSIEINDQNFLSILNSENPIPHNHYVLNGYFQTKYFLHNYSDYIKKNLKNLIYQKTDPEQVFVAYRIGDLDGLRQMLPREYYEEALDSLEFSGGFITSDSIDHPFVRHLSDRYKLEPIVFNNPLDQINFAKNFNKLVLSEGTFSWWIGFLSQAQDVIINHRSFNWFGNNIFDFPNWQKLYWDYDINYIGLNNKILKYTPIKLIK